MSEAAALQTQATRAPPSNSNSLLVQRKCACGGSSGLTGSCSDCDKRKLLGKPLQTKLRINEPGDEYEQEADRVAEQVRRMAEPGKETDTTIATRGLVVQRKLGASTAGLDAAPPIVHDVLSSPGEPLDAATRAFFEPRFGYDFGQVRVHRNRPAEISARFINALAYTQGSHIVFGGNQYAPQTASGRQLIAHELCHVAQTGAANYGLAGSVHDRIVPSSPLVWRREDPRLETYLAKLRTLGANAVGPYGTEDLVGQVFELLRNVDLNDPDNLAPISQVMAEAFPSAVLLQFFTLVEDRAAKERMFELRGGQRLGYGLFPVTTVTIEGFGELASAFVQSSHAFLDGLFAGLIEAKLSEAERQSLASNLKKSALLSLVFPVVFLSGTLAGIGRDVKDAIASTIEILGNWSEFLEQVGKLIHELLHDRELARTLGEETGKSFIDKIKKLVPLTPLSFSFELGKLVGPAIVYTVLSALGVSLLTGAIIFYRLSGMLSRFPRVAKILASIGRHLRLRADEKILRRLLQGSGLSNRPPSAALLAAREALKAGIATTEDYETLLREAINDARDFIRGSRVLAGKKVEPASSKVLTLACGPGRDCSAASLASMASDSVRPLRIHRYQAVNVFGDEFHQHAFSVVMFPDGSQYLVDPTFAQFQRSFSRGQSAKFPIELVTEGFIPLTDANVSNYAAVLRRGGDPGMTPVENASALAARLRNGDLADQVDTVGRGQPGVLYEDPSVHLDRADLMGFAVQTREELLKQGGQDELVTAMEWLINRVENPAEPL